MPLDYVKLWELNPGDDPENVILDLLGKARDKIYMSSRLSMDFYNRPRVKEQMIAAANRTKEFRLLLDNTTKWDALKDQVPWIEELARMNKITIRESPNNIPHWLIVDERYVRLEKPHIGKESRSQGNLVIDCKSRFLINSLIEEYNGWWNAGRLI